MVYLTLENIMLFLFLIINIIILKKNKNFKENFTGISESDLLKITQYENDMKKIINRNSEALAEINVEFNSDGMHELDIPINFNEFVTIKI
jgi:hypothetical protein